MKDNFLLALVIFVFIISCKDDDDTVIQDPQPSLHSKFGIGISKSKESDLSVYNTIINDLNSNPDVSIVAEVNHTENANIFNQTLNFSRTVFFKNPGLETPVLQENILAGVDIPMRIAIYTDSMTSHAAYNSNGYFRFGYNSFNADPLINGTVRKFVENATGSTVQFGEPVGPDLASKNSIYGYTETYNRLKIAIQNDSSLNIIAEVDHQANAKSVNMNLDSSRVIIFENPNMDTPLMQADPSISLDLPTRILVCIRDTNIIVAYSNPETIAHRHLVTDNSAVNTSISQLSAILESLVKDATE